MHLGTRTSGILALALIGCQNSDYVTPDETNTGNPPRDPGTVYQITAANAPAYLGPNLEESNAITAAFDFPAMWDCPVREWGALLPIGTFLDPTAPDDLEATR